MNPYYESDGVRLYHADCLDVLREMPNACVGAVVTDPPAGIGFMGKAWDGSRGGRDAWIAWLSSVMAECLRVLKPGGHALVWAIPRTSHWTATALEDAGFEIRDRISHLFGSGFPKSLDVSKAIDKASGAERSVVGSRVSAYGTANSGEVKSRSDGKGGTGLFCGEDPKEVPLLSDKPVTSEAAQWSGWGTALKPAVEDWWLVRKPLDGTVAANVCKHGTGALNIDGCRVDSGGTHGSANSAGQGNGYAETVGVVVMPPHPDARWPAHLVLSHTPECRCVGTKRVAGSHDGAKPIPTDTRGVMFGCGSGGNAGFGFTDADGKETVEAWECSPDCPVRLLDEQSGKAASRFFYVAKASRSERNLGGVDNKHPTVKSLALMQWLCRLITPPGGIVLDPFSGSGSTLVAALREGFRVIGIEREVESVKTARGRVEGDASLFRRSRATFGERNK